MANTDRTALQTILSYHTDQKLTLTADLNYYLNRAELDVLAEWRKFDPGLYRPAQESASTDTNGIILLEQNFSKLEYLEDGNHFQYRLITDLSLLPYATGYIFLGYDASSNKRQIKVFKNGGVLVSTTLYWYNIERLIMTSSTSSESAIPEEFRHLIADRAAVLYYVDKGPAYIGTMQSWDAFYDKEMMKARMWYQNVTKDPQFVVSYDPDAGGGRQTLYSTIP